jgi:hypothetical protein
MPAVELKAPPRSSGWPAPGLGQVPGCGQQHGQSPVEPNALTRVPGGPILDGMDAAWKTAGHQIAPTILRLLGLSPTELKAVRMEGTQGLPAVS